MIMIKYYIKGQLFSKYCLFFHLQSLYIERLKILLIIHSRKNRKETTTWFCNIKIS